MKYGLLIYKNSYNLGDEIQSIAAMQYLPHIDYYIDRDSAEIIPVSNTKDEENEKIRVIYNGWFDGQYCHFPPNPRIEPLFISFHVNETDHSNDTYYDVLTPEKDFKSLVSKREFWLRFEPVLCRDTSTVEKFTRSKILAEFSGCLTLTLKNPSTIRGDNIVVVDTDSMFPKLYEELVPPHIHNQCIHLYQAIVEILPHEEKVELAKKHLQTIAGAKLVITSRLHTLLPCIAFGTPVIFIHGDKKDIRFSGLDQFFIIYGEGDRIDFDDVSKHLVQDPHLNLLIQNLREKASQFCSL